VINETLVTRSFLELPLSNFESISMEPAILIGLMFEDYLGWNAASLCSLVSEKSLVSKKSLVAGESQVSKVIFDGPWEFLKLQGNDRRGVLSEDGQEYTHIQKILDRKDGYGFHLVYTGTSIGADIIIVAQRESDKKWLLLFVQAKATLNFSTPEAMNTLQLPYYTNRTKNPSIPKNLLDSANSLEKILKRDDILVSFLVIKFPADSQSSYERKKKVSWTFLNTTKTVLELVVDKSNAVTLLPNLENGLDGMLKVKKTRVDCFIDDVN
jgi:hypothetical protein